MNTPEFNKKLKLLVQNAESVWPGVDEAHHLEGLYLATSWGFSLAKLNEHGELWKLAEPIEGSPAWIDVHVIGQSLRNKPFHRKIAEEWINFTLSKEFQLDAIVNGTGTTPMTQNTLSGLTKKQKQKFNLDDPDFNLEFRAYYPTSQNKRDRNGLSVLWNRAIKGEQLNTRKKAE